MDDSTDTRPNPKGPETPAEEAYGRLLDVLFDHGPELAKLAGELDAAVGERLEAEEEATLKRIAWISLGDNMRAGDLITLNVIGEGDDPRLATEDTEERFTRIEERLDHMEAMASTALAELGRLVLAAAANGGAQR